MALNKFMHPRNPYKDKKPDFKALATKYEKFRQAATTDLAGRVHIDFKKPECLAALSWALLKEDFGLDVHLPQDRLIPTIPLRLNYILWLEDLLENKTDVQGIDIGTGASCVYPLLGAKKNGWTFLATETDNMNLNYAKTNVEQNNLHEQIKVVSTDPSEIMEKVLQDDPQTYDFCMCNPPFFGSNMEAWGMTSTRSDDRPEPKSICTASQSESIFPGGEVQFVRQMIKESLKLKDKVRIFTTMLGKKSSIMSLKDELHKYKITNMGTTEFCQGRTMRWGLGWSFDDDVKFPKPPSKGVRKPKQKVPMTLTLCERITDEDNAVKAAGDKIINLLEELKILYQVEKKSKYKISLLTLAKENTWSHQRRKRRQQMREETRSKSPRLSGDTSESNRNSAENPVSGASVKNKVSGATLTNPDSGATDVSNNDTTKLAYSAPATNSGEGNLPTETSGGEGVNKREAEITVTQFDKDSEVQVAAQAQEPCTTERTIAGHADVSVIKNKGLQESSIASNKVQSNVVPTDAINDPDAGASNPDAGAQNPEAKSTNGRDLDLLKDSCKCTDLHKFDGDFLFKCRMVVHKQDTAVVMEMIMLDEGNREMMHQILQYFKNKMK